MKIAGDIGCAFVKLAWFDEAGNIKTSKSSSIASFGRPSLSLGGVAGTLYMCGGDEISVNPGNRGGADTRTSKYPFSTLNTVLMSHSVVDSGLQASSIATGLPLDMYYDLDSRLGGINENNVQLKHDSVESRVERVSLKGQVSVNHLTSDVICPEALSGWIDFCIDDAGKERYKDNNSYIVVDVGGRTTDFCVVDTNLEISSRFVGTLERGVLDVLDALKSELVAAGYRIGDVDRFQLERWLTTKKLVMHGDKVNIEQQVRAAKNTVAREIFEYVTVKTKNATKTGGVFFHGGGSCVLLDELKEIGDYVAVAEAPEFANSRGYLKISHFLT